MGSYGFRLEIDGKKYLFGKEQARVLHMESIIVQITVLHLGLQPQDILEVV